MGLTRRTLIAGAGATLLASPVRADDDRLDYIEYPLFPSLAMRGTFQPGQQDIDDANALADQMPKSDYLATMQALAAITKVGTTNEPFNMRWKTVANPLIIRFFKDIGYKKTPSLGDCTPWCAATVSWCLRRGGKPIPPNPASSQSFLRYGRRVTSPQPGDICVFTDIGDKAHGHVALYLSSTADTVTVLGGNQLGVSQTNCGPGYRKSKIGPAQMAINAKKSRAVSSHYLAAYVRPA